MSAAGSIFLFDFTPSVSFFGGVLMVSFAASLYAGTTDCCGVFAAGATAPPKELPPPVPTRGTRKMVEVELGAPKSSE